MLLVKFEATGPEAITKEEGRSITDFKVCIRPKTVQYKDNEDGSNLLDVSKWMRENNKRIIGSWSYDGMHVVAIGVESERIRVPRIKSLNDTMQPLKPVQVRRGVREDVRRRRERGKALAPGVEVASTAIHEGIEQYTVKVPSATRVVEKHKYTVKVQIIDGLLAMSWCNCEDFSKGAPWLYQKVRGKMRSARMCKHVWAACFALQKRKAGV